MSSDDYILFIDSGIGGLTILNFYKSNFNNAKYIYYADTKNFPYGVKTEDQIGKYLLNIYSSLSKLYNIKLIVIACNTASVSALEYLRSKVNIPIVGTVPAVKPAASLTKNNKIGIIATETTVRLKYLSNLIKQFAPDKEVFIKSTGDLVQAAEQFYSGSKLEDILNKELMFFKNKNIDTLVLGSTHFFFIKDKIEEYFNNKVIVVDSMEGVSKRIDFLLKKNTITSDAKGILYLSDAENGILQKYNNINKSYKLFDSIKVEELSCQSV